MPQIVRRARASLMVLAVIVACGVACGKETVDTNPPATAYVSSIVVAPASDSVTVGNSLQLVATVTITSGTGIARTVTWSSSNSAVASVDPNSGIVKALAVGSVAITARSTFDTTATGAASLTVIGTSTTPTTAATITIAGITQGANTLGLPIGGAIDVTNIAGQINVNIAYDPGSETVTSLALVLTRSGATSSATCGQVSVGSASSNLRANAAATAVTLTCNTAAFDTTQTNQAAVTTFKNGQYTLAAQLTTTHSTATSQVPTPITLANLDVLAASFANPSTSAGAGQIAQAVDTLGLGWRAGSVNVKVLPIIYTSGRTIANAVASLVNGGSGLAGGTNDAIKNGATVACGAALASQSSITAFPAVTFRMDTNGGLATAASVATVTADTVALNIATVDNVGNAGPSVNGVGTGCGTINFVPAPAVAAGNFIRLDNTPPLAGAYLFTSGNLSNIVFANLPGDTVTDNNTQTLTLSGSTVLLSQGYLFNSAANDGYVRNAVANADSNGVGRVSVSFQYTTAPFTTSSTWTTVTTSSAIPATGSATAYNLRMVESDALGNTTITNITFGGGTAATSTFGVLP